MKQSIQTSKAPGAIGPYSQAVVAGSFLFISGQLPLHPETGEMPTGIEAQTRQCLANLKAILEEAGASEAHVCEVSVFLKNMDDFAGMNGEYEKAFSAPYPSRAAVEVARLPKDALVEIKATACL
ncbi:MAG: RidA family protein [Spirochaetales bacterium]|nr:RidA family protein [Spirochaetales bacterium]